MSLIYHTLESKKIIKSEYLENDIYNLLDQTFEIPNKGFSFNVLTISDEYIARPDLVALDAYGNAEYADIICKLNGISNPFELNTGMELILPTVEYISSFCVEPGVMDADENIYNIPIATRKNNKRGANEAVTGDNRFKIDAINGIIIY